MPNAHLIFDRKRVRAHRARAATLIGAHDVLLREAALRLTDRLADINRNFPRVLSLGGSNGAVKEMLQGSAGSELFIECDLSEKMPGTQLAADEEMLPFAENCFDLVISCGALHWVNDLVGTMIQIRHILKPDGLFLAMLPGGQTLGELRDAFEKTQMAQRGGISPRVSPFIDVRDGGGLLQRAGFALPVADSEMLNVEYAHPLKLLHDLRGMGQASALLQGEKTFTPCSQMMLMADYYLRHFAGDEGRVRAGFELVTLTGWKPHDSQQQPSKRGSGQINLGQALN